MGRSGHSIAFYAAGAVLFLSMFATIVAGVLLVWACLSSGFLVFGTILGAALAAELVVSTVGMNNLNTRWVNVAGTLTGFFWMLLFGAMALFRPDNTTFVTTLAVIFAYLALFNFLKGGAHALLISPKRRDRISSQLD